MSNDDPNGGSNRDTRAGDEKPLSLTKGMPVAGKEAEPPFCSFCGRGRREYQSLVSGPDAYICDRCIRESLKIVRDGE